MKNDKDRRIGGHLRAHRVALGMTLKEVGEKIGVSLQQVGKYESGQHAVDDLLLSRFAHLYRCSMKDFNVTSLPLSAEAVEVAKTYDAIKNGGLRQLAKQHVSGIQEWEASELK